MHCFFIFILYNFKCVILFIYWMEGNVLFNNALNTFYLRYVEGRKEMFYLTTHSTHFIYGYMVSDI